MIDVDTGSRTEQRKFGWVMAAAFAVLGFLRYALHGFSHIPYVLWSLAIVFALLAAVYPPALRPVFVLWIRLAMALNWVMTRLLLGIVFYLILTPTGVMYRLFSGDPLKRQWLPDAPTYWEEPEEQPTDLERYKNQV